MVAHTNEVWSYILKASVILVRPNFYSNRYLCVSAVKKKRPLCQKKNACCSAVGEQFWAMCNKEQQVAMLVLNPRVRAGRGTLALQEHLCSCLPGCGDVGYPCGTLCLSGVDFLLSRCYASVVLMVTLSNARYKWYYTLFEKKLHPNILTAFPPLIVGMHPNVDRSICFHHTVALFIKDLVDYVLFRLHWQRTCSVFWK